MHNSREIRGVRGSRYHSEFAEISINKLNIEAERLMPKIVL